MDVVEVDQEELSVPFQLLLVGFGFCLKKRHFYEDTQCNETQGQKYALNGT